MKLPTIAAYGELRKSCFLFLLHVHLGNFDLYPLLRPLQRENGRKAWWEALASFGGKEFGC